MRYATIPTWIKYFEEHEGVKFYFKPIHKRLREAGIIGKSGRSRIGRILKNAYYCESDIRKACKDLFQELPQADKSGFFTKDGVKYGSIYTWSQVLPISEASIKRHLQKSKIPFTEGRNRSGQITKFYSEGSVRKACAELLDSNMPQTDKTGFFEKDGEKYGTVYAWSKVLFVSEAAIKQNLKKSQVFPVKGRHSMGSVTDKKN